MDRLRAGTRRVPVAIGYLTVLDLGFFLDFLRLCWLWRQVLVFGQDALRVFMEDAVGFGLTGDGWNFRFCGILKPLRFKIDGDEAFRGDQDRVDFFFWTSGEGREILDGFDFCVFVVGQELISKLDFLAEQFEGASHAGGETG